MEPNAENSCRRDEIKEKLRQNFDGKIVRKDLTKKIKEGANVPVYVLEFLLGQNIQYLIFQFSRQRLVWEQCRHAKFRDRREDALHTAEFHIALRFSAQFICQ